MSGFVVAPLSRDHDRDSFVCGVPALDLYLRNLVFQDIKRRVAGCFVALDSDGRIGGFYTLAASSVPLSGLPVGLARKLPRYPVVQCMLLGWLAVSLEHRGRGLGRALVADAALRTDRFRIGAYALIVDAKNDEAVAFYRAAGFLTIPGARFRLFAPIATLLAAAG